MLSRSKTSDNTLKPFRNLVYFCKKHNLVLNPEKILLHTAEIQFLGWVLSHNNIHTKDSSYHKVLNLRRPKSRKELLSLIAQIRILKQHIPAAEELLHRFQVLTKKDHTIRDWSTLHDEGLKEIQLSIMLSLVPFVPGRPTVIWSDASTSGHSAWLAQVQPDGTLRAVDFYYIGSLPVSSIVCIKRC